MLPDCSLDLPQCDIDTPQSRRRVRHLLCYRFLEFFDILVRLLYLFTLIFYLFLLRCFLEILLWDLHSLWRVRCWRFTNKHNNLFFTVLLFIFKRFVLQVWSTDILLYLIESFFLLLLKEGIFLRLLLTKSFSLNDLWFDTRGNSLSLLLSLLIRFIHSIYLHRYTLFNTKFLWLTLLDKSSCVDCIYLLLLLYIYRFV